MKSFELGILQAQEKSIRLVTVYYAARREHMPMQDDTCTTYVKKPPNEALLLVGSSTMPTQVLRRVVAESFCKN